MSKAQVMGYRRKVQTQRSKHGVRMGSRHKVQTQDPDMGSNKGSRREGSFSYLSEAINEL